MYHMTNEIEDELRKKAEVALRQYREDGQALLRKYEDYAENLDNKLWEELKTIVFELTADNVINILKEVFYDGN